MIGLTMWIQSAYPIFLLIFVEGFLGGAVYANAFYLLQRNSHPLHKEFILGSAAVADTAGITVAGVAAIFLERAIRSRRGW